MESKKQLMKDMFEKYGLYNNYSEERREELIDEYLTKNKNISDIEIIATLTKLINSKKKGIGKGFFYK